MVMTKFEIPVYRPVFVGNEKKYVNECLDDVWISGSGKFVSAFENEFAKYVGVKHAMSVCNGTVALHLALLALNIKSGDEIIVPTFTYIASVNAIKYCNATPIFIDSVHKTWQLDPAEIRKKITAKTKAIIVPHLYGSSAEMDEICAIAKEFKLKIIEDAAEAFGTKYNGKHVGGFGEVSTFSFFGNKTITCGEGGMVVTNDDNIADLVRRLKGQGLAKNREYYHDIVGYNYRMTNVTAAIGLAQLEKADEIIAKKRHLADLYRKKFSDYKNAEFYPELKNVFNSYWMCSVLFANEATKNKAREALKQGGVETRPLFYPAHLMPPYQPNSENFPVAQDLAFRGINLPSSIDVDEKSVDKIIKILALYIK